MIYEFLFIAIEGKKECDICTSVSRAQVFDEYSGALALEDLAWTSSDEVRAVARSNPEQGDLFAHLESRDSAHGLFGSRGRF
jgi:hypothetical protein